MSGQASANLWHEVIRMPIPGREKKPREQGFTMVLDKGLGVMETKDLMEKAGAYIDFLKLGFGTSVLYDQFLLEEKINLARKFDTDIYPGGTFMEIAVLQNKLEAYLHLAKKLGYTAVEVSDGTVHISPETRARAIHAAAALGFKVLTEVGKKDPRDKSRTEFYSEQIRQDLAHGAYRVIVEGRESGKNTGFYDREGRFNVAEMEEILSAADHPRQLIWEAPLKEQQRDLIFKFGPNVNLGNISPHEVLALEALRVGLRGDTLRWSVLYR